MNREELFAAYRATEFHIEGRDGPFVMKIGEHSNAALFRKGSPSVNNGVFITAHNPHSVLTSNTENEAANSRLAHRISCIPPRVNQRDSYGGPGAIRVTGGVGRDPKGLWPDEPGFFFTYGLPVEYVLPFALEFGQNAFVFLTSSGIPQLIEVDHVSRQLRSSTSTPA